MNKLVYTGPTCYLGQWHFTRGKIYDVHIYYSKILYIMADNELRYYINTMVKFAWKPIMNYQDHYSKNFVTLDKWRELQVNKILNYE